MTYQPLARKYRPSKFADLVGQENVAKALANAIRLGREPHGVIFSGVRGIGKTTTARLYAKALNCQEAVDSEPCGACDSCLAIAKGIHEDVIEIDGASNNGVDEIRTLRETVAYAPQRSRFKVYIIDEVHMLSSSAFNALLKTLEEPPAHVVFIMATTEMHKVPATILSRCLTFYLQKMTPRTIFERVAWILDQEKIDYDEKALWLVAREGQGSMRDALTFLDQAIALCDGKVTFEGLKDLVTGSSIAPFVELLDCALKRDGKSVLGRIADLDGIGIQTKTIVGELANLSRHGLIVRTLGIESSEIQSLGFDAGELSRLHEVSISARDFDLNRIFRTLVKCLEDLDGSSMDRFIAENYLLEWCFDPGLPSTDELRKASIFAAGKEDRKPTRSDFSRETGQNFSSKAFSGIVSGDAHQNGSSHQVHQPVNSSLEIQRRDARQQEVRKEFQSENRRPFQQDAEAFKKKDDIKEPNYGNVTNQPRGQTLVPSSSESSIEANPQININSEPSKPRIDGRVFSQAMKDALKSPSLNQMKKIEPETGSSEFETQSKNLSEDIRQIESGSNQTAMSREVSVKNGEEQPQSASSRTVNQETHFVSPVHPGAQFSNQSPGSHQTAQGDGHKKSFKNPASETFLPDLRQAEPNKTDQSAASLHPPENQSDLNILEIDRTHFPSSWAEFVDRWKKVRPLQARKLEDVVAMEFNTDQIKLGVRDNSIAGKALLSSENQIRLKREFADIFGFNGTLSFDLIAASDSGESLLDIKTRESKERAEKMRVTVLNSPLVKLVGESFGVEIHQIRLAESGQGKQI